MHHFWKNVSLVLACLCLLAIGGAEALSAPANTAEKISSCTDAVSDATWEPVDYQSIAATPPRSFITKAHYNRVRLRFLRIFAPLVKARIGMRLEIPDRWEAPNDYLDGTDIQGDAAVVEISGPALRKGRSVDALVLTYCHELGHHLGGAPRTARFAPSNPNLFSVEGEADYFATLKCMRTYFEGFTTVCSQDLSIPEHFRRECQHVHGTGKAADICVRSILAAKSFMKAVQIPDFGSYADLTSLLQRDKHRVPRIILDDYPAEQCRLDTFIAGALCSVPTAEERSNDSVFSGACTSKAGNAYGRRPACWFVEPLAPR